MKTWHRLLVFTGLALILSGFLFGFLFSLAVDHEARLVAHDAYQPVFEHLVTSPESEDWQPLAADAKRNSVKHRRAADVHGHSTNLGVLLLLVGLLTPVLAAGRGADASRHHHLVPALAVSAVVYVLGLLLQFLTLTLAGEVLAAAGAVGTILSLAALYARIWHAVDRLKAD